MVSQAGKTEFRGVDLEISGESCQIGRGASELQARLMHLEIGIVRAVGAKQLGDLGQPVKVQKRCNRCLALAAILDLEASKLLLGHKARVQQGLGREAPEFHDDAPIDRGNRRDAFTLSIATQDVDRCLGDDPTTNTPDLALYPQRIGWAIPEVYPDDDRYLGKIGIMGDCFRVRATTEVLTKQPEVDSLEESGLARLVVSLDQDACPIRKDNVDLSEALVPDDGQPLNGDHAFTPSSTGRGDAVASPWSLVKARSLPPTK